MLPAGAAVEAAAPASLSAATDVQEQQQERGPLHLPMTESEVVTQQPSSGLKGAEELPSDRRILVLK